MNNPLKFTDPSGWYVAYGSNTTGRIVYGPNINLCSTGNYDAIEGCMVGFPDGGGGGGGCSVGGGGSSTPAFGPQLIWVQGPNGVGAFVKNSDIKTYKPVYGVATINGSFNEFYFIGWEQVKPVDAKTNGSNNSQGLGEIDVDKTLRYVGTAATMLDLTKTEIDVARGLGATSKVLLVVSKDLGPFCYVATGVNTISDVRALRNREMSLARFSYNSTGIAVGIGVTAFTGDPLIGGLAGGAFVAGQQIYDATIFTIDKISQFCSDFNNAVGLGIWYPGK